MMKIVALAILFASASAQSDDKPVVCNQQTYPAGYTCTAKGACPKDAPLECGDYACYSSKDYHCVNGELVQGPGTDVNPTGQPKSGDQGLSLGSGGGSTPPTDSRPASGTSTSSGPPSIPGSEPLSGGSSGTSTQGNNPTTTGPPTTETGTSGNDLVLIDPKLTSGAAGSSGSDSTGSGGSGSGSGSGSGRSGDTLSTISTFGTSGLSSGTSSDTSGGGGTTTNAAGANKSSYFVVVVSMITAFTFSAMLF